MKLFEYEAMDESGAVVGGVMTEKEIVRAVASRLQRAGQFPDNFDAALALANIVLRPLPDDGGWSDNDWSVTWKVR